MSSEETDVDLPVAAEVTAVGSMPDEGAAIQNFVQISEGDELVKRQDAEEAIKEARQQERQKIVDKIEKHFEDWNYVADLQSDDQNTIEVLEQSIEELREELLEEEVEEA